jgi:hypothetical protein
MTNTTRSAIAGIVVLAVTVVASPSPAAAPQTRIRGANARLDAVISEAVSRSQTFRRLVDTILMTDGIVYVVEGECGQGVRACLLPAVTIAGDNRLLRIVVDARKSDQDLMGSIGHELQHAIELLSDKGIRSSTAAILRVRKMCSACGLRFETDAALKAGDAVRAELSKHED